MHRARKRFGQNFLRDPQVVRRIADAIDPKPGEALVEIGPGLGALTTVLLGKAGELDVVELDRDLIPALREACAGLGELRIHEADALKFDFRTLAARGPLRVVGNLPYNISTPLLFHLLAQADIIRDMHFMLQKEVVERMAAGPGGGDYGRLSVMVQYRCAVERLFTVAPGAFTPRPKVDSAIVRLVPWAELPYPADDEPTLRKLVNQAFSQRRKTLRNCLKGLLETDQIAACGIDPGVRPETLSVAQFVALANAAAGG